MSDAPVAPPVVRSRARLAVISLACAGAGILSGIAAIVLEGALASEAFSSDVSPSAITVTMFLVPTFYLAGVVIGIVAIRMSARGRRGLAVAGLAVNGGLLVLTGLGYLLLTVIFGFLGELGG